MITLLDHGQFKWFIFYLFVVPGLRGTGMKRIVPDSPLYPVVMSLSSINFSTFMWTYVLFVKWLYEVKFEL